MNRLVNLPPSVWVRRYYIIAFCDNTSDDPCSSNQSSEELDLTSIAHFEQTDEPVHECSSLLNINVRTLTNSVSDSCVTNNGLNPKQLSHQNFLQFSSLPDGSMLSYKGSSENSFLTTSIKEECLIAHHDIECQTGESLLRLQGIHTSTANAANHKEPAEEEKPPALRSVVKDHIQLIIAKAVDAMRAQKTFSSEKVVNMSDTVRSASNTQQTFEGTVRNITVIGEKTAGGVSTEEDKGTKPNEPMIIECEQSDMSKNVLDETRVSSTSDPGIISKFKNHKILTDCNTISPETGLDNKDPLLDKEVLCNELIAEDDTQNSNDNFAASGLIINVNERFSAKTFTTDGRRIAAEENIVDGKKGKDTVL